MSASRLVADLTPERLAYVRAQKNAIQKRRTARLANDPVHRARVSWTAAKQRVTNPHNAKWALYGGRGIRMAPEWMAEFAAFLRDMGPRPVGTTLDRIDPDGDYEPGNCRWATATEQRHNRRTEGMTE